MRGLEYPLFRRSPGFNVFVLPLDHKLRDETHWDPFKGVDSDVKSL